MVVLLFQSYEIWYSTVLNAMCMALLGLHFHDQRAIGIVMAMFGFELIVLLDANGRAVRYTIFLSCVGSIVYATFGIYVAFGLIDASHNPPIFPYGQRTLYADDVITNGLATAVVLLLRNGYRKYTSVQDRNHENCTIPCITYRCRLRLRQYRVDRVHDSPTNTTHSGHAQLRYVACPSLFDPRKVVFPWWRDTTYDITRRGRWLRWHLGLLKLAGCVGLVLTVSAFLPIAAFLVAVERRHLDMIGALASSVYSGACVASYQRALLRLLLSSFDFVFLSLQISLAHLCVCDLFMWDHRCVAVASSWMWIHWVITLDALPPVRKYHLGVRKWSVCIVIVCSVLQDIVLCVELVSPGATATRPLQDREIFSVSQFGHTMHVHVVPFFLSRLFSILSLSARLLWRVVDHEKGELILIQGKVEYEDRQLAARRARRFANSTTPQRDHNDMRRQLAAIMPHPP